MKKARKSKQKRAPLTELGGEQAKGLSPLSVAIERNELVVKMPLHESIPSKSGKTMVIASTMGALPTGVSFAGASVILNANAYIKPSKQDWRQAARVTMARIDGRVK